MNNNKALILANALYFIQKARVSAQVRKSHLSKSQKKCELTEQILLRTNELEDWLNAELRDQVKNHPAYFWFSKIKGIGNVNIGKVISLIDIEKASMISKLWRFAGFGCNGDGSAEKAKKGEKLHYNKILKSMCWRLAKGLIRARGAYYDFYIEQKNRITERLISEGHKIIPSNNLPKEKGKHVEKDAYFGLGHVDMMAMRKMIKLFLSHLWLKWREAEGLEISKPYVHAIKGHSDFRSPDEFIG